MTTLPPSETQLTPGEQHSAPHIHHALTHFSFTDHFSFYLPTYVLSPLPSSVHPGVALPTTSITELLPKQVRQLISLFSLRTTPQACFFLFLLRTARLSLGRGEESGRLIHWYATDYLTRDSGVTIHTVDRVNY